MKAKKSKKCLDCSKMATRFKVSCKTKLISVKNCIRNHQNLNTLRFSICILCKGFEKGASQIGLLRLEPELKKDRQSFKKGS